MQQTDVSAVTKTASATAFAGPARVKGLFIVCGATAGSVVLKNNGASGTTLMDIATPASATATIYMLLPGEGVRFTTDVYATITNATSVTVFYG